MAQSEEILSIKIDKGLLDALRRKVGRSGRSISDLVNDAIESDLDGSAEPGILEESPSIETGPRIEAGGTGTARLDYIAFISYSHADEKLAATIHKFLERFRVPRALVGRAAEHGKVPARIRPVFRDQEEFSASADLGRAIRDALEVARTLVVICTPRSARSRWVGEEIRHFKRLGREDRIYCLIANGEPVDAGEGGNERASFHPALLERFDVDGTRLEGQSSEPLAVDLREDGLPIACIKLAAGVLGVGYDDLYRRFRRQKLRNSSLLAGITTMVLAAGAWLFVEGLHEKRLNRAQQFADVAKQHVYTTQPLAGLALALHALATAPNQGEPGGEAILRTVRDLAIRGRVARLGGNVENVIPSADGSRLVVDHVEANGELRSGYDGTLLLELTNPIYGARFLDNAPGYLIADYRGVAELRLAASGASIATLKSPVSQVTFGLDHFFVSYSGGHTGELRHIADGALVPLTEGARPSSVTFSQNSEVPLMTISYYPGYPPELRRTDDISVVALNGKPKRIQLSPDAETGRVLVTYEDKPTELLRTADLSLVWRHDAEDRGRAVFVPGSDGRLLIVQRGRGIELLRSTNGSSLLTGTKRVMSPDRSLVAILAGDGVEWFRSRDGERLGSVRGEFGKLMFSKDRPSSRLMLRSSDGWELRAIEDGSLVARLSGADKVDPDVEFLFVRHEEGAEIRRLDDGSLVLSLGAGVAGSSYPSPGVIQVRLDNDSRELRRLSDGSVVKEPLNRTIEADEAVGPDLEYQLIRYVGSRSELKRSIDGATLLRFGGPRVDLQKLTFIPDPEPSHVLARYEDGSSSLIALTENGVTVPLPGTAVSIDPIPAAAPRYLLIRYDDGHAEIWRGLDDIRQLGHLGTNLEGYSLADSESALTVWYANGWADVLDLDWLEQATEDGITDERLFSLACEGPLAGFDVAELSDRLAGETWHGCTALISAHY